MLEVKLLLLSKMDPAETTHGAHNLGRVGVLSESSEKGCPLCCSVSLPSVC